VIPLCACLVKCTTGTTGTTVFALVRTRIRADRQQTQSATRLPAVFSTRAKDRAGCWESLAVQTLRGNKAALCRWAYRSLYDITSPGKSSRPWGARGEQPRRWRCWGGCWRPPRRSLPWGLDLQRLQTGRQNLLNRFVSFPPTPPKKKEKKKKNGEKGVKKKRPRRAQNHAAGNNASIAQAGGIHGTPLCVPWNTNSCPNTSLSRRCI